MVMEAIKRFLVRHGIIYEEVDVREIIRAEKIKQEMLRQGVEII